MNKLIYLGIFTLVFSLSACHNNDDNNNDPNALNGSFHAVIDGNNWDAEPENVIAIISGTGTDPFIAITGTSNTDTSHFYLSVPVFNAADTVINDPDYNASVVLRFQSYRVNGGGAWDANTGTINVSRSTLDGIETYVGTFNGNFRQVFDSTQVKTITGGTFTAKRYL